MTKRILSGMQPTSNLHLGNYLGALKNWVDLQEDYDCFYCVVDQHAITMPYDPKELTQKTREIAAAYIAGGIDVDQSVLFVQSTVPAHTQLHWLFETLTPMGWLNRMTQFKDKAGKNRDKAGLGLYAYPILMAADILIYKADAVPVGDDQKQHLELAREIAGAFNRLYGDEYFTPPEPKILGEATRVMSLRDGTQKMSKSAESDMTRINLTDDADMIAKKIKKAKTDPEPLPETVSGLDNRPEAKNLLTIYAALSDQKLADILPTVAGQNFSEFKPILADRVVETMAPITQKMRDLLSDPGQIDDILQTGNEKAREVADKHIKEIYDIAGFWKKG